jgi:hypothetical protein
MLVGRWGGVTVWETVENLRPFPQTAFVIISLHFSCLSAIAMRFNLLHAIIQLKSMQDMGEC